MPHVLMGLNVVQLMEPSISISWVCLCEVFAYIHSSTHTQHYIPHHNTHTLVYVQVQPPPAIYLEDRHYVELVCEVYGYPRNSSHPVWTTRGSAVQNDCRHCINRGLFSSMHVSYDQIVESVLSILNMTVEDAGKYTRSVSGNSSAVNMTVWSGKFKNTHVEIKLCHTYKLINL